MMCTGQQLHVTGIERSYQKVLIFFATQPRVFAQEFLNSTYLYPQQIYAMQVEGKCFGAWGVGGPSPRLS